jgi:hypothetical protein
MPCRTPTLNMVKDEVVLLFNQEYVWVVEVRLQLSSARDGRVSSNTVFNKITELYNSTLDVSNYI